MTIPGMIGHSLKRHGVSSAVTAGAIALAMGLCLTVWLLRTQSHRVLVQADGGYDAVLGARGSPLQLVLNAVFHLDASPGNVRWADYEKIRDHPLVEAAVPLAAGDSFRGWRVVGTLTNRFATSGRENEPRVRPGGRVFDPQRHEAVLGSFAARRLGLRVGDQFAPSHGVAEGGETHAEEFLVVGILEPSNGPADRVIWVPLAAIQHMEGHDPAAANDVSAVLVRLRGRAAAAGFVLSQAYNRGGDRLTFAWPIGAVIGSLFDKLFWLDRVLQVLAWLVAVVAAGTVLASLHNTIHERQPEIAILRALGARRRTIFALVLGEALVITAVGCLAGFGVYAVLMGTASGILQREVGVVLELWRTNMAFVYVPLGMLILGGLAGVFPALTAYRTPVVEHLDA